MFDHSIAIGAFSLDPAEREICVFGDAEGGIHTFDGKSPRKLGSVPKPARSVAIQGSCVCACSARLGLLLKPHTGVTKGSLGLPHVGTGRHTAISGSGKFMAFGTSFQQVVFCETDDLGPFGWRSLERGLRTIPNSEADQEGIAPIDFQPGTNRIACRWFSMGQVITEPESNRDHHVQLFDCEAQERVWSTKALDGLPTALDFSSDGKLLAVAVQSFKYGLEPCSILILDSASGEELHRIDGGVDVAIKYLDWSPSGKMLASAGTSPRARVWSIPESVHPTARD